MSDLLNQASLVMVPSGYKEDTVYSVVPSDGSGDLTFTRASNGTRVNSAGLVEDCPWNLLTYSEDLSNGAWSLQGSSVTTDSTIAPNGTTTADTLIESNTTDEHNRFQNINISGQHTFSVYLKKYNVDWCALYVYNPSVGGVRYWINVNTLTAGTSANIGAGIGTTSLSLESVGNGWVRASILFNNPSGDCRFYVANAQSDGGATTYAGDGTSGVYVWGAQVNLGTLKPYFPTTDRLNVPRLTYQNGGGGCPSLLLEKQSTNLVTYSEQFDDASWSLGNSSITANATTSPDGTQNAEKLYTNTATSTHQIRKTISSVTAQNYTMSIFAKKGELNYIRFWEDGQTGKQCYFNLNTGVATNVDMTSASIENMGNGWFRCSAVVAIPASGVFGYRVLLTPDGTTTSFTGNGSDGVFLYGAQLEASSYPTSYIPTTSSSATRVADVATVNLPNTNMTFTAYLECEEAPLGTTAGDWFAIYSNVSVLGRAYGYANQFGFADAYNLGVVSGEKMVWKQESGSTAKIFKGGTLVGTSTTGTYTNPFNRLRIDGALLDKPVKIKQFVFFDNALTDAECIQLTA